MRMSSHENTVDGAPRGRLNPNVGIDWSVTRMKHGMDRSVTARLLSSRCGDAVSPAALDAGRYEICCSSGLDGRARITCWISQLMAERLLAQAGGGDCSCSRCSSRVPPSV